LAEAHGFALVLLDVDLDTSTPIGRASLGILSVVAELEREQTRQRTKAALAAKRARGQRQGPGPLLDPDRRRWIAEQVEWNGRSRKGLAAELTRPACPPRPAGAAGIRPRSPGVLASVAHERELHAARTAPVRRPRRRPPPRAARPPPRVGPPWVQRHDPK
jgi:Resolvase, N terminal domain